MKKYLMTGMAALAMCAAFTSCSKDIEQVTQEQINQANAQKILMDYENAFIKTFGQPAANQHWGFGATATRSADPDANMWGGNGVANSKYPNFVVPDPLTSAQIEVVRRWFQQKQNPDNHAVDFTNFFVQQVYKGGTKIDDDSKTTETYLAGNGDIITSGQKMDYLMAGQVENGYDHMYNFNGANYSNGAKNEDVWDGELDPDESKDFNLRKKYHKDMIQLMVNSSTSSFGYHTSQSNEQFHNKYVVIPGDIIDPIVAGMYFVGFDYEATGENSNQYLITEDPNGDIEYNGKKYHKGGADGYYSDWIVRITKAEGTPVVQYDGRIIAEDLTVSEDINGTAHKGDFDFNDVVFDYKYTSTGVDIILRAAGGTLPLRLAGSDNYEVHKLLGVGPKDMVNTGRKSVAPVSFSITGNFDSSKNGNDIKIEVNKGTEANPNWIELKAEQGRAPGKVRVDIDYNWCAERQDIDEKYSATHNRFSEYVGGQWAWNTWYNQAD
jgi:hypothetical protein